MEERTFEVGLGGYKILQAPNMTPTQMMSYLITTPNGELIVIDGGWREDTDYLVEKIHEFGSKVSLWIITHVHHDHYLALTQILEREDRYGITIEKLCYNFPPQDWILDAEPQFADNNKIFFAVLPKVKDITHIVEENEELVIDGMTIEFMHVPDDYNDYDPGYKGGSTVNDTSIVFKMNFPTGKTALFMGDLGFRAGQKLAEKLGERLKSDIVQMAHHGQNGAGEDVYKLVKPELCMWTAPMWLYDNNMWYRDPENFENKFNSHYFKTVTVREWMDKLGVKMHAVEGEGPAWIE